MFLSSLIFYFIFTPFTIVAWQMQNVLTGKYSVNSINCPDDKRCTFIELCPIILDLMDQDLLPIHRFRQAICGYEERRVKVCCDVDSNTVNPYFTREDSVSLTRSNSIRKCGKSYVDGDVNSMGMYPFVARIGFKSDTGGIKYPCSGAILNERTILTTASCALATSNNYKLDSVRVGDFKADNCADCSAQKINISYVIKHPNYRAETFTNNVAMLRLKEPIRYTVTAQPVCVLPRDKYVNEGVSSILVGWGKLSSQREMPCKQQYLKMRVISNQECMSYSTQGLPVELCAIGNETPCSGYNGSPLLYKHRDTYFMLGILSYGFNCDTGTNFPSVFVNVQKYVGWILENS